MKILVVSLLRLGDVILATPVLKGLKEKYPEGEIHLLMNKQFENLSPLIPYVDQFNMFDRKRLQQAIGDYQSSIFEPLDTIDTLIDDLNSESYDLLINLTQNKLSGWLSGIVAADEKRGLAIEAGSGYSFGSPWFRYMNDYVAMDGRDPLHFIDIFYYGSNLKFRQHAISLMETSNGKGEANQILGDVTSYVCIQPFTSEAKKDWGIDKIVDAIRIFATLHPKMSIVLLGAPFEAEKIQDIIRQCQDCKIISAICSFEAAFSILSRAQLLLTGDTSIMHLACSTDCKIIELSLGSSSFRKTGVYKPESIIIQSNEPCAPCPHNDNCDKERFFCSERVSAEPVALAMSKVLQNNVQDLRVLAEEYKGEISIYRTHFSHSGFWYAHNLLEDFSDKLLYDWIHRSSLKLYFQNEHKKLIGEYSTESIKVKAALTELYPQLDNSKVISTIDQLATKAQKCEEQLNRANLKFKNFISNRGSTVNHEDLKIGLKQLDFIDESPVTKEIIAGDHLSLSRDFAKVRKLQNEIQDIYQRNQIKIKLLRTLRSQLVECL